MKKIQLKLVQNEKILVPAPVGFFGESLGLNELYLTIDQVNTFALIFSGIAKISPVKYTEKNIGKVLFENPVFHASLFEMHKKNPQGYIASEMISRFDELRMKNDSKNNLAA